MSTSMQVRMRLLRVLEVYSPNSAPTQVLLDGANAELPRKLTLEQLGVELVWLCENGLVAKLGDALDPEAARWVITRVGLGALQQ
jgi:hypothetical protein